MEKRGHGEAETLHEIDAESGYMLLAVVVLCALVLIALAVAAPMVAKDLQRDKEVESQHRAEQYERAIRLYYRKTKSYPPSIEALKNTNNVRFLRQEYVDPLTGKADWRLIKQGQQQTKTRVFFGQELTGLSGGLGSAAGLQSPGQNGSAGSTSTSTISAGGLAGGFNGASITSTTGGTPGTTGTNGTAGSTSAFGDGTGGIIVGVGTAKTGDSITQPNQQTTYETWEFWYDPNIEQLYQKGQQGLLGGASSTAASSFGSDAGTGKSNAPGGGTNSLFGNPGGGTTPLGGAPTPAPGSGTPPSPGGP
jgi:type II secretory pathway pseudopilin PulG